MTASTPPSTTAATATPPVRSAVLAATTISVVTLLIATFELSMADWPSSLVLLGILPLIALLFFGCGLWSAILLIRVRRGGLKFAVPFLICALTLAILAYAPLQQIALQRNFDWHRAERERIVARVEAGDLKPNVDTNENLIALGDNAPNVSAGGNDIVVDNTDHGIYVLILTSRGLKHTLTRFLHIPPGGAPNTLLYLDENPPKPPATYDK